MAERIIQKSGNPAKVTFPEGMDRQGAIVESIAQKVDPIRGSLSAGPASKKPIFGATAYKRNRPPANDVDAFAARSEEHTSELQSLMRISYAVFCLKKKSK